jgi:hypothetical protein
MMGLNLYRPSLRALGAIGVLVAWVASLAWLGFRELGQSESATITSQAALRLAPEAAWFAILAGEAQVGSAGVTLDTLSPGYRILETVTLDFPGDTGLVRATRRTETRLAGTLELESVESRRSEPGRQDAWILRRFGDTLRARFASGSGSIDGSASFGGPIATASGFPYRLALSGALAAGNERPVTLVAGWPPVGRSMLAVVGADSTIRFADSSVVDPSTGRFVAAHFDSVKAYSVVFNGPSGPERLWIDRRGSIVGAETVFGLRWQRGDFDLTVTQYRRQLPQNVARIRAVLPTLTPLVGHRDADTSLRERRFRVEHRDGRPIDHALLALLAGGRQAVQGDTVVVRPEPFATLAAGFDDQPRDPMIPDKGGDIYRLGSSLRELGPTRQALRELAATLRRRVKVDTSSAASLDARGALRTGRAQPDGLVRLYVAVLRASGVPARMVTGVSPMGEELRTHSWAEVRDSAGVGWLAVDPVLGRVPASTSLIRIGYGGSSQPEEMLALLADVKFIDRGSPEILP